MGLAFFHASKMDRSGEDVRGAERSGSEWKGKAFFHASTRERSGADWTGAEWKGSQRIGLFHASTMDGNGSEGRGQDWKGVASFRCPQRMGTEWIGVERMGEDGPISCVHKGAEWNGKQRIGRDGSGLERRGSASFKLQEVSDE